MLYIAPTNGQLIRIKVYNALGLSASVNKIGFLYNTGIEHTLGFTDNALLAFFLNKVKRLVKVIAYKYSSVILYLEVSLYFSYYFYIGIHRL
jgi:hypothetical protein